MSGKVLDNIEWYSDQQALDRGEPSIYHSYMAGLATALKYTGGSFDPVWLMGSSAFAFRIFINENMCPSAMSIFDWTSILPEAVEQMGFHCLYVSRLWHEADKEEERKKQAHASILEAIDGGVPAVVWDIYDSEWGLIIGYDMKSGKYNTLTCHGNREYLAFDKLGKNGIDILSVAIRGEPNRRSRDEVILNSLRAAVAHAEQKEWNDRPRYQDGLPAFDQWASIFEKWAIIEEAGRSGNIGLDILGFSKYYAGHYYSARCYAREYLKIAANGNRFLNRAFSSYEKVAGLLKPIWLQFSEKKKPDAEMMRSFSQNIKDAKAAEAEGIGFIKEYIRSRD